MLHYLNKLLLSQSLRAHKQKKIFDLNSPRIRGIFLAVCKQKTRQKRVFVVFEKII